MTHRNADTETDPVARSAVVVIPSHWTPEETRAWIDMVAPPKHRNADQRIREAFDALRAEIEAVFKVDTLGYRDSYPIAVLLERASQVEDQLHAWAKLPADA